jgi:hypothetical protein
MKPFEYDNERVHPTEGRVPPLPLVVVTPALAGGFSLKRLESRDHSWCVVRG